MQPQELKRLCAHVANKSGTAFRTQLTEILQVGQADIAKAAKVFQSEDHVGLQVGLPKRSLASDYHRGPPSLQPVNPCRHGPGPRVAM